VSLVFSWSQSEFTRFVVKYEETGLRPSLNRTFQTDTNTSGANLQMMRAHLRIPIDVIVSG